jgi:hypothetical protein
MSKSSESIDSRISLNEDRLMDDDAKPISIQLERSKNYIYLPGEYIQGKSGQQVTIATTNNKSNRHGPFEATYYAYTYRY